MQAEDTNPNSLQPSPSILPLHASRSPLISHLENCTLLPSYLSFSNHVSHTAIRQPPGSRNLLQRQSAFPRTPSRGDLESNPEAIQIFLVTGIKPSLIRAHGYFSGSITGYSAYHIPCWKPKLIILCPLHPSNAQVESGGATFLCPLC